MTYRKLAQVLSTFSDTELDMDVAIYVANMDEFFELAGVDKMDECDVLDEGHPYLVV